MRRTVPAGLLSSVIWLAASAHAQTYRPRIEHPIARYKMSARLDPVAKKVTGQYTLTWWNHTSDTIPDLYFHLYLNAFKNLDSTFMRESGERRRGEAENQAKGADRWGWVDVDKIQIAGGSDLTALQTFVHPDDDNAADQTVMRIALPQPIPPLGSIELAVDF